MRHTISLQGDHSIKSQKLQCKRIPSFQQQCIIKIQQNNKSIYAIYTPIMNKNPDIDDKNAISMKYLQLNKIQQSLSSITRIPTPEKIKNIQIQLSPIDYQLVNNNFSLLQTSFLDQVNIVWPDAKIPLYYDGHNYITLHPKVNKVFLVDPYAAISFSMKEEIGKKQNICQNTEQYEKEQQQMEQKVLLLQKIDDRLMLEFGYDNLIYLKREHFQYVKNYHSPSQNNPRIKSFYCTLQTLIHFTQGPTLEQFTQYRRLQVTNKIPQPASILIQIAQFSQQLFKQWQGVSPTRIHEINHNFDIFKSLPYRCSSICKETLGLPQKLGISKQLINSFSINQTISVEMFVKYLNQSMYQIGIQVAQENINQRKLDSLKRYFAQKFIEHILKQGQFVILHNYHPFLINKNICNLILRKRNSVKQNFVTLKNFILVRNCAQNIDNQGFQLYQKYIKIIAYNTKIQNNINSPNLSKWIPIRKSIQQKYKNIQQNSKISQFNKIFETCFQQQLQESIDFLKAQIQKQQSSAKILFSTYSSNGKTYLQSYLNNFQFNRIRGQDQCSFRSWYLDCKSLAHPQNRFDELKEYIQSFISLCPYKLIYFDNIQAFLPNIEQGDQMRQKQKMISHVFSKLLTKCLQIHKKIAIFTSKSQTSIDPFLKFKKVIKLKNPNRNIRAKIVNQLKLQNYQQKFIQQIIDKTESLSLGSFSNYLINRQIPTKSINKKKNNFNSIVGLKQAKQTIKSVIQKPNKFGFIYEKVKIKVPRGILLYGATGNGKSALGSAVQDQFNMKFFTVKGSDILSKYIGGSQAAVRQIFQKALSVSPSIIFFDQFESIVPRRNSGGTGVTDRVVNQFLCYLDGVSSTTGIFIIAASSRPDLIDPAVLRPGRIDSHIYLEYPNDEERQQLLRMFQKSVQIEQSIQQVVKSTENYSYADLIGLLKQLRIKRSSFLLKQKQNPQSQQFKTVSKELFHETLKSFRIGTAIQQQNRQKQLFQRFKSGKGPQVKKQKFVQM